MSTAPPDSENLLPLSENIYFRALHKAIKRVTWNQRQLVLSLVAVAYMYFLVQTYAPDIQLSFPTKSMKNIKFNKGKGRPKFVASDEEEGMVLAEFGRRKKRIREVCEKLGAYTTKEKFLAKLKLEPAHNYTQGVESQLETWSLMKKSSHHQFFLEKTHELLWCKVPKAASTSWLYAFLQMANVQEHEIPEDNGMGLHALLREKYPLLAKNLYKKYIPLALKFMVARHPFERLMSAYLDKLDNYNRDLKFRGGYFFAMYGADIVEKYRERYQKKFPKNPVFLRKEPSFVEFIHYLIETPVVNFDEHWRPMYLLCPPCHFTFDVIVKMETFDRDSEFILRQRNLDGNVSLKKKHSAIQQKMKEKTDPEQIKKSLFSQLSKKMVKSLYDKYRVDFDMFEYDMKDYIRYATDSEELMPDVMEVTP